jgi:hypothetical protein
MNSVMSKDVIDRQTDETAQRLKEMREAKAQ